MGYTDPFCFRSLGLSPFLRDKLITRLREEEKKTEDEVAG